MKAATCLSLAFGFIGLTQAWKLDESCTKKGKDVENMVVKEIKSAFSLASKASTEADNFRNGKEQDENIKEVFQWLFLKDEKEKVTGLNFGSVQHTYQGIAAQSGQKDTATGGSDIIFYCDHSHFEKVKFNKYKQKDTGDYYSLKSAKSACSGGEPTVAWASDATDHSKPSIVQLCPWFIDWMKAKQDKSMLKATPKGQFWNTAAKAMSKLKLALSPIDLYPMMDKVILHELTHTRAGGNTADVDESSIRKIRYGWKRCVALAQEGTNDNERRPSKNADSLALAASAIRLIQEGKTVQKDGTVDECS